jgi:DNA-directed RNA polymerase subunit N (RpoN/RPB10)
LRQDELGMISYRYDSYRKDVSIQAYEQEADSLEDTGLARYSSGHSLSYDIK